MHGNTSESEALELGRVLESRLGARAVAIPRTEVVQLRALELPTASLLRPVEQRNPEQDNHAMQVRQPRDCACRRRSDACCVIFASLPQMVLRCGTWQPKRAALVEIVAYILTEPYFDQLRTKETVRWRWGLRWSPPSRHDPTPPLLAPPRGARQLGYIVWSGASNVANALGLQFIIQSDKADPEYLDSRTEARRGRAHFCCRTPRDTLARPPPTLHSCSSRSTGKSWRRWGRSSSSSIARPFWWPCSRPRRTWPRSPTCTGRKSRA